MSEITNKNNNIGFVSRVLIHTLVFALLCGLGGQKAPAALPAYTIDYSVDDCHTATEQIFYKDVSTTVKALEEFEVEVNEDDDTHDHSASDFRSAGKRSVPRVITALTACTSFQNTKATKLYILFHSWKSFLFNV
jgi:hypothetical protein